MSRSQHLQQERLSRSSIATCPVASEVSQSQVGRDVWTTLRQGNDVIERTFLGADRFAADLTLPVVSSDDGCVVDDANRGALFESPMAHCPCSVLFGIEAIALKLCKASPFTVPYLPCPGLGLALLTILRTPHTLIVRVLLTPSFARGASVLLTLLRSEQYARVPFFWRSLWSWMGHISPALGIARIGGVLGCPGSAVTAIPFRLDFGWNGGALQRTSGLNVRFVTLV
jgi:hypothetical protein